MEAEERIYRERTGRILEQLAAQADEVVRVVCGIGQKIK
jgi:adenosyl cobinamide kinase/adenosyl cobinamide phosphate guanylyltransferase